MLDRLGQLLMDCTRLGRQPEGNMYSYCTMILYEQVTALIPHPHEAQVEILWLSLELISRDAGI